MGSAKNIAIPLDLVRKPAFSREKIKSLEELSNISLSARELGKKVTLAHGVFDLVHMGHVRHLESAKTEGDILIVTITPDEFVNKGPDRPVFKSELRAEMLAALQCVDWVGINQWPSSELLINMIKPNIYVKGSDYTNEGEDITGKIKIEKEAVEKNGGKVIFTDEITFSSSSLINQHLNIFEPPVVEYLSNINRDNFHKKAMKAINSIKDMNILFIGETIIDEYQYAKPMGKSAKENIISSAHVGREVFAGGVIAAANHVADFVNKVDIFTILGEREPYLNLVNDTLKANVNINTLWRPGVPTTRKCRYVDPGHMKKLFEVYHFDDMPLNGKLELQLLEMIEDRAKNYDLVIATDFGHGLMTDKIIEKIEKKSKFLAVNAQSNSANLGYNLITKYKKADYVCIDAPEARLAMSDKYTDLGELIECKLSEAIDCNKFIVTHGEKGCVSWSSGAGINQVPAFTSQVVDTVGAGDAFLSVTSPLVAAGNNMDVAGFIGNVVGALKVGIVGHRKSVDKISVLKYLTTLLK